MWGQTEPSVTPLVSAICFIFIDFYPPFPLLMAHNAGLFSQSSAIPVDFQFSTWWGYLSPQGLPGGSDDKESAGNAGGLIPGWGRSPGEGNSNPLQYSCLEKPMSRGAWWTIVHGVAKNWTRLSN